MKIPRFASPSRPGWLGVDIGSTSVKLAQTQMSERGLEITMQHLIPITAEQGGLSQIGQLLRRQLPVASGRREQRVACLLPASNVELLTLELPDVSHTEALQMAEVEIASRSDGEPREFDVFQNAPRERSDDEMVTWSVLSIKHEHAMSVAESLWSQRFWCESIDTTPCVLARAVQIHCGNSATGIRAAIDWGVSSPSLTLIQDGHPIYSRSLRNCGIESFIESGAEVFQCTAADFHELLIDINHTLHTRGPETVRHLLDAIEQLTISSVDRLLEEVDRTLNYVRQEYPSRQIEEIVLLGGGCLLPNCETLIAQSLDCPVSRWQVPLDPEQSVGMKCLEPIFAAAITLSMSGDAS